MRLFDFCHVVCIYMIIRATSTTTRARRNDEKMKNEKIEKNTHVARTNKNCFTIVELCREHDIDAKIARRRMRDAIKRDDDRIVACRVRDNVRDDMRVKHEFVDNAKNSKMIFSFNTNS